MFFTEKGRCLLVKSVEIPEGDKTSKGRAIQNLMQLPPDDKVRAIIDVKRFDDEEFVKSLYCIVYKEGNYQENSFGRF